MKFLNFDWILKRAKGGLVKKSLQDKDPYDFTKTESSTDWVGLEPYCPECLETITFSDSIAETCPYCGSPEPRLFISRISRYIRYNGERCKQSRYKSGKMTINNKYISRTKVI